MKSGKIHSGMSDVPTKVVRGTSGEIAPYQGADPDDLLPYVTDAITYHRADWTSLRPPASTATQETWSKIATPFRAVMIFGLWLSWAWWRVAIFWLILATLAMLAWVAVGGA